jgi:Ca-activated chloride channel family protein
VTFAGPHLLWLLLVVPAALVVFFWWSARTRQKLMTQFIQGRLLPGLVAGVSPQREKLRGVLMILAVCFLILALAGPQFGYDLEEVKQRGLDIVVAIDTSKSMLAEDIAPNRLARAKYAAIDLMQQAASDRLGLVAFAGTAFLQCPLTIDDSAFRQVVESLDVNTLPEGGTALADAIQTAQTAFKEGENHKVLVLFTDGEDHDSAALDAAKKAAKAGMRIFTIGIGSVEGELLRIKAAGGQSDYVRDQNGNVVKSHLNEHLLREIAGAAGGFYLPLRGAKTIDTLYENGLAPLPKSESQEKWVRRPLQRYHWPLTAAITLLLIEVFFPERKTARRRSSSNSKLKAAVQGVVLLLLLSCVNVMASPSGALRDYNAGNFDKALDEYERSLQKKSDDPRLHFNAGTAAYRSGQFDQAAKYFEQAMSATDLKLQERAYYNLGNTFYQQGEQDPDPSKKTARWEDAIKRYESSLKLNPQDADAQFNLNLVKKKLEELKQQRQQNQDSNQDKDQKNQEQQDNQDQQKQDQQNGSDSEKQKQDQSKNSEQQQQDQNQQQQQSQSSPDKEDQQQADQQKPQRSEDPQTNNQQADGQEEAETQSIPGQMTQQQAKQLLDAQKGDEMMVPIRPEKKRSPSSGPVKDW